MSRRSDLDDLQPWQRRMVQALTRPQHRVLLAYLCRNGPTVRPVLEAACDVASVTTRMAELVTDPRCSVRRWRVPWVTAAGRRTWTVCYEVSGPGVQRDLFDEGGEA